MSNPTRFSELFWMVLLVLKSPKQNVWDFWLFYRQTAQPGS